MTHPPTPHTREGIARRLTGCAEFYPWTLWFGIHFDPHVVRSGDSGVEECWDLHILFACWEFQFTLVRRTRTYWQTGDSMLDLIGRDHEQEEASAARVSSPETGQR